MSSGEAKAELLHYDAAAALVARYAARVRERLPAVERVELEAAAGRILAEALTADRDQPPFARSTRDGYACRAAEASAHGWLKVAGTTRAGQAPAGPLAPGTAWEIMTGAPVPAGADAVVMLEHVETDADTVRLPLPRSLKAGENVVARGAQGRMGDKLLPAGSALDAGQIALAAACGSSTLAVFQRPRVAILTTGDEIVPVESQPGPGQIRNSNGPMLAALVRAAGGEAWVLPSAADTGAALDAALAQAAEADLLLITGGVSAGKFDLVEPALARMGAKFHFTGVRIQPGKPLVFGELERGADGGRRALAFFGLPGNPVSSAVTFLLFARPVLRALCGCRKTAPRFALARLAAGAERGSKPGLTRFLPAICDFGADDVPEAAFVPWQGSGDLTALARANCFLVVPEDADSLEVGAIVKLLLF